MQKGIAGSFNVVRHNKLQIQPLLTDSPARKPIAYNSAVSESECIPCMQPHALMATNFTLAEMKCNL